MTNNRDRRIDYIEFVSNDIEATYTSFSDGRIAGGFRRGEVQTPSSPLVVIFVEDLDAARQRVVATGGSITKETFSFPGGYRFHFHDPSGNELSAWHEG
jgi:predicted enzyme related to lactoylglutathione lyase